MRVSEVCLDGRIVVIFPAASSLIGRVPDVAIAIGTRSQGGYLQELPEACRRVIDLHRLQGVGQQDVAVQLGVSERMVRRYLTYTLVYCQLRLEGLSIDRVRENVSL